MVQENEERPTTSSGCTSSHQRGRKRKSDFADLDHNINNNNNNTRQQEVKRQRRPAEFLRKLDAAISELLTRDINHLPSTKDYMELYSEVYENLVDMSVRKKRCPSSPRDSSLLGCTAEDIYARLELVLKRNFRSVVQEGKLRQGEELLQFYVDKFALFKSHVSVIDGIFAYMNRVWVQSVNRTSQEPPETVYTFCVTQWRSVVFDEFSKAVSAALLKRLEMNRSELRADDNITKMAVESFIIISDPRVGSKSRKVTEPDLELYEDEIEAPFLKQSQIFYQSRAQNWVASKSVPNYILDVEQYLSREEAAAGSLFHNTTVPKLSSVFLGEFVRHHSTLLLSALSELIAQNDLETLRRIFGLLLRLEDFSLDPAVGAFKNDVVKAGLDSLTAFHKGVANKEIEGKLAPIRFVDSIVQIFRKYENVVSTCLSNQVAFRTALDEGVMIFVNQNDHTKTGPDQYNLNKTPELLARYANSILTAESQTIDQEHFPDALNKLFLVLKFTESKDSFEKYYNWNLLNRLIHKSSVSEENETLVITEMKSAFGQDFSMKAFQLTQDARISEETSKNFKISLQDGKSPPLLFDFAINVFKNGSCKLPDSPPLNLAPPFVSAVNAFSEFYGRQYEGRRLMWYHNKSHGELVYNAGPKMARKYTFIASTYQMTILLLFNEKLTWSFHEIQDSTLIDSNILGKILAILERTKLLCKNSEGGYSLYEGYRSNKFKHDINIPVKADGKTGGGTEDPVDEDVQNQRKFVLQAVVVRLMKSHHVMRHSDLIAETIAAARHRFKPSLSQIKRTIDCLIEKGYLKRDDTETDKYVYIS